MKESRLKAMAPLRAPDLVPEIAVTSLPDDETLESFRQRHQREIGMATPYWTVAWPGGQALARFLLDNPDLVTGRTVLDIGCGNGLVALAAARAGAARVVAVDFDPLALAATRMAAETMGLRVETNRADFTSVDTTPDLACAGDLWYDCGTGRRATTLLRRLHNEGAEVLVGDAERGSRIRQGIVELVRYHVDIPAEFARSGNSDATVSRLV